MDRHHWRRRDAPESSHGGNRHPSSGFNSYRSDGPGGQPRDAPVGRLQGYPPACRDQSQHSSRDSSSHQRGYSYQASNQNSFYQSGDSDSYYQSGNLDRNCQSRSLDKLDHQSGSQRGHNRSYAGDYRMPGYRGPHSSGEIHRGYPPAPVQEDTGSQLYGHTEREKSPADAGYNVSGRHSSGGRERFHPYKPAIGPRGRHHAPPQHSGHSGSRDLHWSPPGSSHQLPSRSCSQQDYGGSATSASWSRVSQPSFGPHEPQDALDDDENEEDDLDDDDDDDDNYGDATEEEQAIQTATKKGKKFFQKRKKAAEKIFHVEPVLSFDEYTQLWENEQNPRMKKLRLMACQACVSTEPRSIAKISNSRNAECNLRVRHRYDRELAKRLHVPVVAHLLLDGILAATGSSSTKEEAKRAAFDEVLRALYMPYLRIFTAQDEHRELHASMVPFSEASEEQILKPILPMAPKVIEHTKFRQMPPNRGRGSNRGRRRFRKKK